MTPSHAAVAATLELRRWARRQHDATGLPPTAETLEGRVTKCYPGLKEHDRAYVLANAQPQRYMCASGRYA